MIREEIYWSVTEAFAKFGFGDGDGDVFTDVVVDALEEHAKATAHADQWGLHNTLILHVRLGQFHWDPDGYTLPAWELLPEPIRLALQGVDAGLNAETWASEANDPGGLEIVDMVPQAGMDCFYENADHSTEDHGG